MLGQLIALESGVDMLSKDKVPEWVHMDDVVEVINKALAEEREMIAAWLESDEVGSAPWRSFDAAQKLRYMNSKEG